VSGGAAESTVFARWSQSPGRIRRVASVGGLAVLPLSQVGPEAGRVEAEFRRLLNEGMPLLAARLDAARSVCSNLTENALEEYWSQLRTYARQHYVEPRDVTEVIDELTQRYVDADLKRRQTGLTGPFMTAR
jgi:hypothetical protein